MLSRGARQTSSLLAARRLQRVKPPCEPWRRLNSKYKPPVPEDPSPRGPHPIQEHMANHAAFTVHVLLRWLKYSVLGVITVTLTSATVFECAHQYVESVELAPEKDEEVKKWQWDVEAEKWTGGTSGGTDPALGFLGRHAVRAAFMSQNWGTGSDAAIMNSSAFSRRVGAGNAGMNFVEHRLEAAQSFVNIALSHANAKIANGTLRPQTIPELLARHANIMERMGQRDALYEARSEYERVWSSLPGKGVDAARIALKLGDVNRRLGDLEDALGWWTRSIQLLHNKTEPPSLPEIPPTLPSEPLAQRTYLSALVSLSAFYATTGQLRQAQNVEESSLKLLQSVRQPESLDSTSAPEALHALYILHRSSLLSIHLAEVLYALRKKQATPLNWLTRAASSSERVALILTGLPLIHPDAPDSKIPHPPSSDASLVSAYAKNKSMQKPALSLLRDARRTAAEAWSLMGILAEESAAPGCMERALDCYERALGWAGVAADRMGGIGNAGEGTLEAEWKVLWSNYVRARAAVKKQDSNAK